MATLEGPRGISVLGRAELVEESRELAWAERYVRSGPDVAWILGNFVCADTPNYNGHIFPLEDLKTAHSAIANKPLNLLHRANQIVGNFAGSELLYPTSAADAAPAEAAAAPIVPFVEAVATFYRYYFPKVYEAVQAAHAEGKLHLSMECVPKSLTCAGNANGAPGCGATYEYAGRRSDAYCTHLNAPGAKKKMNKPLFTAGALVLPPAKPGWKDADVTEMSKLMEEALDTDELHSLYTDIATQSPHLDPAEWERVMATFVNAVLDPA